MLQHGVSQERKAGLNLLDVEEAEEFADGIAHLLGLHVQPQPVGVARARGAGGELPGEVRGVLLLAQDLRPQHLLDDLGMGGEQLVDEGAAVEQQRQHAEELRVGRASC